MTSLLLEHDDLDYSHFDIQGGLRKMFQLFSEQMDALIDEAPKKLPESLEPRTHLEVERSSLPS